MLSISCNEAARRSTWMCLSCSALPRTSQALIAMCSRPLPVHGHQRKHSSSKTPSSPSDDSRAIATPSEAPTTEAKPIVKEGPERRSSTRLGRRKYKDITQEALGRPKTGPQKNLPSVPATRHLPPVGELDYRLGPILTPTNGIPDIHVASFFSIHRPISVTTPYPSISTESTFSSIFSPRKQQKPHPADVIYTISSAVENLEAASHPNNPRSQQHQQQEESDLRAAVTEASSSNAETTHLDAQPQNHLYINIQELAKNFRPFVPPPPPVAMGSPEEIAAAQLAQRTQRAKATKQKSYSTVLRILETTHPDGQITYKTRTSPIREDPISPENAADSVEDPGLPPKPRIRQPFLNRMKIKQEAWEESVSPAGRRVREQWRAISTKRQRKLKMKKHKYKKLMRRTRNLRRRLDRN